MAQTNIPTLGNQFSPAGRLVMGSLTEKQDKDLDGNPIAPEDQEFFFGLGCSENRPRDE